MGEVKLLHAVLRLVAEHRAVLEQTAPLVQLVEKHFQGMPSDLDTLKSAIAAELRVLSEHHSRLHGMLTTVHQILDAAEKG